MNLIEEYITITKAVLSAAEFFASNGGPLLLAGLALVICIITQILLIGVKIALQKPIMTRPLYDYSDEPLQLLTWYSVSNDLQPGTMLARLFVCAIVTAIGILGVLFLVFVTAWLWPIYIFGSFVLMVSMTVRFFTRLQQRHNTSNQFDFRSIE